MHYLFPVQQELSKPTNEILFLNLHLSNEQCLGVVEQLFEKGIPLVVSVQIEFVQNKGVTKIAYFHV